MTVSVVIPVYNGEKYLSQAIDSVLKQQGDHLHEVIVVDDGSTDNTQSVAKKYASSVKYLYQKNKGVGAARNNGAHQATGQYLAFLDADDIWHENKLEQQVDLLEKSHCSMAFTHVSHFKCPLSTGLFTKSSKPMPGLFAMTLLITTEAFARTEGFSEELKVGEFIDWYSRAKTLGIDDHMIQEVLAYRRVHDDNMTITRHGSFNEYARVLKWHLDRKRMKKDEE